MAEALVSVVVEKLASIIQHQIQHEVRLVMNVKQEVEELTSNFQAIQVVLENAEERQVKEVDVRRWLDKLTGVSYEMDDVLDEWSTEILKQHIEKQEIEAGNAHTIKKKVCFYIPVSWFHFGKVSQVILRRDIALKIKQLNESLASIANERQNYNFQYMKRGLERLEPKPSYSFVDTTFGRMDEKEMLLNKLLGESGQGKGRKTTPLVIPIIGMGGIGKTTLAQLAYNDEKVQTHFSKRIWVCVSHPFDKINIAKAIIESLKNSETPASNTLQTLLQLIHESIKGKKFLLVLDDVWTQDYSEWEPLMLALHNGAIGSRIVVTTRKQEVAMMMRATDDAIHLKPLNEEHCWSLFSHIALVDRARSEDKVFEVIGKEIVKKCKGLPLVAKTLGGLLRYKETKKEWLDVLNSKIWELEVVEEQLFRPFFLSYYDLSSRIRRCLLYCVTFPKGSAINKNNLIELWMSQGYLHSNESKEKETIGELYFDNLVMRSFFQEIKKDVLGKIKSCKMHDLMHDFLQLLTKNECLIVEVKDGNEIMQLPAGENRIIRHLTLMFARYGRPFPMSFNNSKTLRSLVTFNSDITTFSPGVIAQLKGLRSLNLSRNYIKELPKEVGELVHLRYLDLSYNYDLQELPDSVGSLFNLQTLRLIYCNSLRELPEVVGKLVNLRHLHVLRPLDALKFPKAIARLDRVWVGGNEEEATLFGLGDLSNLDQLRGSIRLSGIGVKDVREAEKARLVHKEHLVHLKLLFEANQIQADEIVSEEILNALRPHPNLENLHIAYYGGTSMRPNWLASLNNLRRLSLVGCTRCEFLPPLGKLVSLETLWIAVMGRVKKVGVEFLGLRDPLARSTSSSSLILFPSLKQLTFIHMKEWEEWEGIAGWNEEAENSQITIMPCLSSLTFENCDMLKALPDFLRKTPLQALTIKVSPTLIQSCMKKGGTERPKISHIPNMEIELGYHLWKDKVWMEQTTSEEFNQMMEQVTPEDDLPDDDAQEAVGTSNVGSC